MERRSARIDGSGRLVVPATVRRELELLDGDEVVFAAGDAPHEVRLMSRRAAVAYAQALVSAHTRPRRGRASDELIADRRRDAAREAAVPSRHRDGTSRQRRRRSDPAR